MKTRTFNMMHTLLGACLLLLSSALWAVDTDGDGFPDEAGGVSAGVDHTCALDDAGVRC